MKIECKDAPKTTPPTIPCLMVSKEGTIILVTKAPAKHTLEGVCVRSLAPGDSGGEYSDDWARSGFTPYTGTVTLKND